MDDTPSRPPSESTPGDRVPVAVRIRVVGHVPPGEKRVRPPPSVEEETDSGPPSGVTPSGTR